MLLTKKYFTVATIVSFFIFHQHTFSAEISGDSTKTKKPVESFGDIFNSHKLLLGKNVISGNVTYLLGRTVFEYKSSKNQDSIRYEFRNTISASLKIRFYKEFNLKTNFFYHLNRNAYQPWTADYFYSLTRFNWRPNTFSYGYENYANNRYTDNSEQFAKKFLQGYYFISYNHNLPEKVLSKIRIDKSTNFNITYLLRYAINYRDKNQDVKGDFTHGKTTAGISSRYMIAKNFFIEGGAYFYLDEKQKSPWDADYTWGFGYFDWRPFKVSFTYGNWVINRFNGKNENYSHYSFPDGDFSATLNFAW